MRALDAASAVPLATVERSGFPESKHLGAAVVVASDGRVLAARGGVDRLVYPRSALKPFQTVAALRAGAMLDAEGLVIVTSSHAGTDRHVAAVQRVLAASGLDEGALQTPEAWPDSRSAARAAPGPSRIAMGCSGNHAGMLAGACAAGWSVESYLAQDHPIHALAEAVIAESTGATPTHRGIDGCGGPVWAIPLVALAGGYARTMHEQPALAAAIRAEPVLVEGAGSPTTRAIERLGVVAKSGAEGVWCAVAPNGTAVAVKVLDGSSRAAAAVGVALLAEASALGGEEADAYLADPALEVRGGGTVVGRIRIAA